MQIQQQLADLGITTTDPAEALEQLRTTTTLSNAILELQIAQAHAEAIEALTNELATGTPTQRRLAATALLRYKPPRAPRFAPPAGRSARAAGDEGPPLPNPPLSSQHNPRRTQCKQAKHRTCPTNPTSSQIRKRTKRARSRAPPTLHH